ncbi:hypothetical protein BgiMline_021940 [Biomphalaria glabrata]|uniref:Uncharacterized protein n=1 Tax=Biomphalaria pfeifferi TaxID=112525 RepID=A0AAD8BV19_BIOPF|nr:hypothetical protein BgiMline_028497 [Biomphalaria glabrata]KAK0060698.1 hypothetical protein Bpfe_009886 [Biomphalaria pfeifferi]
MISAGDSTVHFTKLKPMEMAEMRSVLEKRPKQKFIQTLSPEAQEAMHQVSEEAKIQMAARRGHRGSRGNVLFNETVQIRQEVTPCPNLGRRGSVSDVFENSQLDNMYTTHMAALLGNADLVEEETSPRRVHGRRRSSVTRWVIERRGSLQGSAVDEVAEVQTANMVE